MTDRSADSVVVLGIFVADTAYRAQRQPKIGETILGKSFALGPGGKGSNQSVAAAMAGAKVHMITRLGCDPFADMARQTWEKAGVAPVIIEDPESYTGAAYIFIEDATGNNSIIVAPGAAARICKADIDANADLISRARVFMTQLEQPIEAAHEALKVARKGGAITILNPAPAAPLSQDILQLCDYLTPNESEAEGITGIAIKTIDDAKQAAGKLVDMGVGTVIVTLGEMGALLYNRETCVHVPAINAGDVVETTGAGDAFNGGFAAALSRDMSPLEAVRYGVVTAGISVTRAGTAPAMPSQQEIDQLYSQIDK